MHVSAVLGRNISSTQPPCFVAAELMLGLLTTPSTAPAAEAPPEEDPLAEMMGDGASQMAMGTKPC
jgi:hypothetical protein